MSDPFSPARTITLAPAQGERFSIIGGGVRILIDGPASGGRCTVLEAPIPPGDGPPRHRHEREDELFYVLDGRFKFVVDGVEFVGERGAFACAPRGSIHAFKNIGPTLGTLLVTCTPAGIEIPFRAIRAPEPHEAAVGRGPPTMEQAIAELAKHGITFHGPPLE
jgi:quercetin dioxygenase-like cupin family protein